jgi:hypothetical protein
VVEIIDIELSIRTDQRIDYSRALLLGAVAKIQCGFILQIWVSERTAVQRELEENTVGIARDGIYLRLDVTGADVGGLGQAGLQA